MHKVRYPLRFNYTRGTTIEVCNQTRPRISNMWPTNYFSLAGRRTISETNIFPKLGNFSLTPTMFLSKKKGWMYFNSSVTITFKIKSWNLFVFCFDNIIYYTLFMKYNKMEKQEFVKKGRGKEKKKKKKKRKEFYPQS